MFQTTFYQHYPRHRSARTSAYASEPFFQYSDNFVPGSVYGYRTASSDLEHLLSAVYHHQRETQLRQRQLEAIRQQRLVEARRQYELQLERRRQVEIRRQQLAREHQRRVAARQRLEAESVAQAVSFALEFFDQLYSEGPQQVRQTRDVNRRIRAHAGSAQPRPQSTPAPAPAPALAPVPAPTQSIELKRSDAVRRVRFAEPSTAESSKPATKPIKVSIPTSSKAPSSSTNASAAPAPAPAPAKPVRIPIRDNKGKGSSHVRINSIVSPTPAPATSLADAVATLTLLSSDLDDYLAPSHIWKSNAHRQHALNQLLEQVDAVESDGEEVVRDARRALVHRVERALDGQSEKEPEPRKTVGIQIREPEKTFPVATAVPVVAAAAAVAEPEVVGYDIPDVLPVALAPSSEGDAIESTAAPATSSEWTTVDPAAARPIAISLLDVDPEDLAPTVEDSDRINDGASKVAESPVSGDHLNKSTPVQEDPADIVASAASEAAVDDAVSPNADVMPSPTPLNVVAGAESLPTDAAPLEPVSVAHVPEKAEASDWEDGEVDDAFEML